MYPILRRVMGLTASLAGGLCLLLSTAEASVQLLQNGGFEAGMAGWTLISASTSGCTPRSGSAALMVSATGAAQGVAQQQVGGVGAGLGPYTLSGYSKLASGSVSGRAILRWVDASGATLKEEEGSLALASGYGGFSVSTTTAPALAGSLLVRLVVTGGTGSVCFDDLSLDGPAPVTPTPVPTSTPSPTWTPLATVTPTRTPTAVPPTRTRVPPSATKTPPPPTSTRSPSATPSSSGAGGDRRSSQPPSASGAPGFVSGELLNGGFEGGVAPWQKFGGELRAVSSPANSGSGAGAFSSSTASTKWAYQVVRVEPGGTYEFQGFVRPGDGVSEAFLRVSWYSSPDGSGRTTGSTDSTEKLSGPAAGFVHLTTGSVAAPEEANSARVRVMLAPASAARAAVYLDDFAFGPSEAPPRATTLVEPAADEDAVEALPAAVMSEESGDDTPEDGTGDAPPEPGPTGSGGEGPRPGGGVDEVHGARSEGESAPGGSPLLYVLLGSSLTAAAAGGAVSYARRTAARR